MPLFPRIPIFSRTTILRRKKRSKGQKKKTLTSHLPSVTIAAILRTTSVHNTPEHQQDPTYHFVDRGVWTLLEANLGIISACLPILKHPLTRLFPRLFSTTTTPTTNTSHNNHATTAASSNLTPHHLDPDPNNTANHWPTNPSAMHNRYHHASRFWRHSLSRHEPAGISRSGVRAGRSSDEHRIVGGTSLKGSSDGMIELEERRPVSSLGG